MKRKKLPVKRQVHRHRYKQVLLGKDKDYLVYACQLPDCAHYIRPELLSGKVALCYYCTEEFKITDKMLIKGKEVKKLHCESCNKKTWNAKPKEKITDDKLDKFLSNLGFAAGDD